MNNESYIGIQGKEVEESEGIAKLVSNGDKNFYFVLLHNSALVDPYNEIFTMNKRRLSKYINVNEAVYKNYVLYLKTKQSIYYNRARRMMG